MFDTFVTAIKLMRIKLKAKTVGVTILIKSVARNQHFLAKNAVYNQRFLS